MKALSPWVGLVLLMGTLSACSTLPAFAPTDLPETVTVTDVGDWIVLEPRGEARSTGVVFYPGGLVKPEAYEPALAPLAASGYPVVIAKMPFDLAFFDAEKGVRAGRAFPGAQRWVLAGHSLGGVAAAIAVDKHPEAFAGLILWASYAADSNDLSTRSLPVLSVEASEDGLSTPAKIAAAADLLPVGTEHFVIEGGNHAQFGSYGPQKGDGVALISREEQQRRVAEAVLAFLRQWEPLDTGSLSP